MIRKLNCGFITLTYACNNRCQFCYAAPRNFDNEEMDLVLARQLLELMKSLGVKDVGLTGGEPSLYPHLTDLVHFAKQFGLDVTVYTNGRLLSDISLVKRLKAAGTDFVNISVQSIDAEEHDSQCRVEGAFQETKQGIENCFKEKLKVNLETVLTHTNFSVYKDLMGAFSKTNRFVFYREIPPITDLKANYLSNEDTRKIVRQIFSYAKGRKADPYFFARMPYCWFEKDKLDKRIQHRIVSHCHILAGNNLIADIDGSVLPCAQWVLLPSMKLAKNGKVVSKKQFLKEWNKGKPAKARETLTKYPAKECVECKDWGTKCTGGCPLTKFELPPWKASR